MKLKILCLINNEHDKEIVNKCKKKQTKNKTKINKNFWQTTTFNAQPNTGMIRHHITVSLWSTSYTDFISVIHVHLLPVKYHRDFAV